MQSIIDQRTWLNKHRKGIRGQIVAHSRRFFQQICCHQVGQLMRVVFEAL